MIYIRNSTKISRQLKKEMQDPELTINWAFEQYLKLGMGSYTISL